MSSASVPVDEVEQLDGVLISNLLPMLIEVIGGEHPKEGMKMLLRKANYEIDAAIDMFFREGLSEPVCEEEILRDKRTENLEINGVETRNNPSSDAEASSFGGNDPVPPLPTTERKFADLALTVEEFVPRFSDEDLLAPTLQSNADGLLPNPSSQAPRAPRVPQQPRYQAGVAPIYGSPGYVAFHHPYPFAPLPVVYPFAQATYAPPYQPLHYYSQQANQNLAGGYVPMVAPNPQAQQRHPPGATIDGACSRRPGIPIVPADSIVNKNFLKSDIVDRPDLNSKISIQTAKGSDWVRKVESLSPLDNVIDGGAQRHRVKAACEAEAEAEAKLSQFEGDYMDDAEYARLLSESSEPQSVKDRTIEGDLIPREAMGAEWNRQRSQPLNKQFPQTRPLKQGAGESGKPTGKKKDETKKPKTFKGALKRKELEEIAAQVAADKARQEESMGEGEDTDEIPEPVELSKEQEDLNWELGQKAALGNLEAVTSLVSQGADVCGFDGSQNGLTPLMNAASKGKLRVMEFLLENRANVNARNLEDGGSALCVAAKAGKLTSLEFLVHNGADVKHKTNSGETALDLAKAANDRKCVAYLAAASKVAKQKK